MSKLLPALALVALTSCSSLHSPTVDTSAGYVSQYWFRGAIQNERGGVQGDVKVALEAPGGDRVGLTVWGNVDTSNDAGDAPFPDGNGGDVTEIDLVGWYQTELGTLPVEVGFVNYDFPNDVGTSTTEVYGTATWALGPLALALSAFYDFDLIEDYYVSAALTHGLALDDRSTLTTALSLGYMGDDQAAVYFAGASDGGVSDLNLGVTLEHRLDEVCTAFVGATATTVGASALEDAVEAAGYEDSGVWLRVGLRWSY